MDSVKHNNHLESSASKEFFLDTSCLKDEIYSDPRDMSTFIIDKSNGSSKAIKEAQRIESCNV